LSDGETFVAAVAERHPAPFRAIPEDDLRARAVEARSVVDLMRLGALLGDRNGHTGIVPFAAHARPLRAYPFLAYELADGVVAAAPSALAGRELAAVGGVAVDEVLAALAPLVSRDNEWTVRARRPQYLAAVEVLAELGLADGAVDLRFADGTTRRVDPLEPGSRPPARPRRDDPRWIDVLDCGRAVHVVYNVTRGDVTAFADEVVALASRPAARRVVLDLRENGGGDNRTYGPLLAALERVSVDGCALAVLIGRETFSAAMQLVVDLERRTPAVFVGEPTGGSPNQYGDAVAVPLPESGLTARVATISWETAGADDARLAREPDVHVAVDVAAFLAGRDVALEAALALDDPAGAA
jgi:hypothetical protein